MRTKDEPLWRRAELQAVTDHVEDFISILDLEFRHRYVNRALARAVGRDPDAFVGKTAAELGTPQPLCDLLHRAFEKVARTGQADKVQYQTRTVDGHRILESLVAPIRAPDGPVRALIVVTRDVTDWKNTEALHGSQNQVMREIAGGADLARLMKTIIGLAEQHAPGRVCSLLLLDEDGRRLRPGCAPQLPAELIAALTGDPIGPEGGSCGAAAFHRRLIVSDDIARDPAWGRHREAALRHGLHASWSEPILSPDGELLGTFAMYARRARLPSERDLTIVHESALISAIAIRHSREHDRLLESETRYRLLTENAANIVVVSDLNGVMRYVSPAVETILGYKPEELIGRPGTQYVHPDDLPAVLDARVSLREQIGSQGVLKYRYLHRNGSWRTLEAVAKSSLDHRGNYVSVISARDVTDREQATEALERSEERLERALQASGLGLWDWDLATGELFMDAHAGQILGNLSRGVKPNIDSLTQNVLADDALPTARAIEAHLRGETAFFEVEARMKGAHGGWKWVGVRGQVSERNARGEPVRLTGTLKDIDAQKRMQDRLASATGQVQLLLDSTDEGIIGLDQLGTIIFVNPSATRMLGFAEDEMLGQSFDTLIRHTSADEVDLIGHDSPIVRCLLEGQRYRGSDELFWRDDTTCMPVEYSVSPITSAARTVGGVLVFRDISERQALARQLRHQAQHDPLTGLINRRGFEQRLAQLLGNARTDGRQHALCYLDLDHFKLVNDTCGHVAGDELLRQLPPIMQPLVRKGDTIARLGGDEFAILLEDCPLEQAARVAETVRDAIRDFRFTWQFRTFTIGACIGVVGITAESHGIGAVLGAADTACYVAKDQGANHVHVSHPHDLAVIRRRGEMRWVARIKNALEEDQFRLHFQSVQALDEPHAAPVHHELLVRLIDAKGDLIMPGAFIPAAERYQLMANVDRWVIEHALAFLGQTVASDARWRQHRFGINLSGESLRDSRLLTAIEQGLARHNVPATCLYFEITETAAISNLSAAVALMHRLRELGCQLALDDFGSGMSSFSYLKHLPVDYLKIDGSFIRDIVDNAVDQSIVRAVQGVCAQMGIATVAEYVASPAILECVRGMGVNYAQGFAIAHPLPLERFPQLQQPAAASAKAG